MIIEGVLEEIESFMKKIAQELPPSPAPPSPPAAEPELEAEPALEPSPSAKAPPSPEAESKLPAIQLELPDDATKMTSTDLAYLLNLLKVFSQAVKKSDTITISFVTTELKKLFEKYKTSRVTSPFISVYSFLQRLQRLKSFQDKSQIIDVSARKLASEMRKLHLFPICASIVSTETYDFEKIAKSGKVVYSVEFLHNTTGKRRNHMVIGVKVKDLEPVVDETFTDNRGNSYKFDKEAIENYIKGWT